MPRQYNPRAISREAKTLRAETLRDSMIERRRAHREARRVQSRLESVERYGPLRKAYENVLVQDAIDAIELRHINHERVKSGIPPYKSIDEMNHPPALFVEDDFPPSPPPYKSSDYS